jgi:2-polyprenyl-3-methyl-5-hydroxy-6-metoxy-1,4-benzoquinol methylase
MTCLICGNKNFKPYYYPPTRFNGKVFNYFECASCASAQIDPLPDENDMKLMYGTEDHAYLLKEKTHTYPDTYPKYNHQKFQLDFFERFQYSTRGKTLLDIGCGSGFYMNRARKAGMECMGIEFDTSFAKLLREKTGQQIFSFEEFETSFPGKTFDMVHMGHVLEHSTDPLAFLNGIKKYCHASTIVIVDGPLEKNKCFSRWLIRCGSMLKRNKLNTYHPQHITFTNRKSQLAFFERCGLAQVNYSIAEQMFPFPSAFKGSVKDKLLFLAGRISVNLSKLIPGAGNIFHYAGRFK